MHQRCYQYENIKKNKKNKNHINLARINFNAFKPIKNHQQENKKIRK